MPERFIKSEDQREQSNLHGQAGEMAQWVKAFVAMPDDLSSVPTVYVIEGENQSWQAALAPPLVRILEKPRQGPWG